jgi:hypothetical protein
MNSSILPGNLINLDTVDLLKINGGADIWGVIDKGCTLYGTYALIVAITPGANLIGGGTVGAFCAGYKLASWLTG